MNFNAVTGFPGESISRTVETQVSLGISPNQLTGSGERHLDRTKHTGLSSKIGHTSDISNENWIPRVWCTTFRRY